MILDTYYRRIDLISQFIIILNYNIEKNHQIRAVKLGKIYFIKNVFPSSIRTM